MALACSNVAAEPIIACIRGLHTLDAVATFRDDVALCLLQPHTLVCFTDRPGACDAVNFIDTTEVDLPGEWARLLLFEPTWRGQSRVIYFDLDLSIVGDLTPLTTVPGEFHTTMDQSLMVIGAGMAGFVWTTFAEKGAAMRRQISARAAVNLLYPRAPNLRHVLPGGFIQRGCVGVQ
jgi:hypothetical protein